MVLEDRQADKFTKLSCDKDADVLPALSKMLGVEIRTLK